MVLLIAIALAAAAPAQTGACNQAAAAPSINVALPSQPFAVTSTKDGCSVFVSFPRGNGIAVLKRGGGRVDLARVLPVQGRPAGIVLTHDEKLLIAAAQESVIFLDAPKMIAGAPNPVLGSFSDGKETGSVYAAVSPDDRLLFVSEEGARAITVIDLDRARKNGYKADAILGQIPAAQAPVALAFSPDGKWLYNVSQVGLAEWNWEKTCKPESPRAKAGQMNPQGALLVVDVARARTDAAHSVVARAEAGCNPVRIALSPAGDRIYLTARGDDAVLAFDTARLRTGAARALVGKAPTGPAPVPIAVVDGGRRIIAGNSNRFEAASKPQNMTILDASKLAQGAAAVMATMAAGVFPRELSVSADGRTVFLTNFQSKSLQVMDVTKLGK